MKIKFDLKERDRVEWRLRKEENKFLSKQDSITPMSRIYWKINLVCGHWHSQKLGGLWQGEGNLLKCT